MRSVVDDLTFYFRDKAGVPSARSADDVLDSYFVAHAPHQHAQAVVKPHDRSLGRRTVQVAGGSHAIAGCVACHGQLCHMPLPTVSHAMARNVTCHCQSCYMPWPAAGLARAYTWLLGRLASTS